MFTDKSVILFSLSVKVLGKCIRTGYFSLQRAIPSLARLERCWIYSRERKPYMVEDAAHQHLHCAPLQQHKTHLQRPRIMFTNTKKSPGSVAVGAVTKLQES